MLGHRCILWFKDFFSVMGIIEHMTGKWLGLEGKVYFYYIRVVGSSGY